MEITIESLLMHTNACFFLSRVFELTEWIIRTRMPSMINIKKVCNVKQCLLDPTQDKCSCVVHPTLASYLAMNYSQFRNYTVIWHLAFYYQLIGKVNDGFET